MFTEPSLQLPFVSHKIDIINLEKNQTRFPFPERFDWLIAAVVNNPMWRKLSINTERIALSHNSENPNNNIKIHKLNVSINDTTETAYR